MKISDFEILTKDKEILVYFYTPSCSICKMLEKELSQIEIDVIKINAEKERKLSKKYGIMSVPMLIYFKNNKNYRKHGYHTHEEIVNWLNKGGD